MKPEDFTIMDQLKLMGHGESDTSGCWIKFQVLPEHQDRVRGLKGEIFEVTARLIDNGDTVGQAEAAKPTKPKGGKLARDAGIWCQSEDVIEFAKYSGYPAAETMVYEQCDITSRAYLDHDESAAKRYLELKQENIAYHRNRHV